MILIIDNYDSFTFNLYQMAGQINPDVEVIRNDKITVESVKKLKPSHLIISPGPGYPKDAGICEELILNISDIPILGVCLGHQAIGESFGGRVVKALHPMHGKAGEITVDNEKCVLFQGLPSKMLVGRYHSLIVDSRSLPSELETVGLDDAGQIMALKHKKYHIYGIQFHPESVLTPLGHEILKNFLSIKIDALQGFTTSK